MCCSLVPCHTNRCRFPVQGTLLFHTALPTSYTLLVSTSGPCPRPERLIDHSVLQMLLTPHYSSDVLNTTDAQVGKKPDDDACTSE